MSKLTVRVKAIETLQGYLSYVPACPISQAIVTATGEKYISRRRVRLLNNGGVEVVVENKEEEQEIRNRL